MSENRTDLPKDPKEIFALAKENGIELTDKQIEAISGGEDWEMTVTEKCSNCGTEVTISVNKGNAMCPTCGTYVYTHFPF